MKRGDGESPLGSTQYLSDNLSYNTPLPKPITCLSLDEGKTIKNKQSKFYKNSNIQRDIKKTHTHLSIKSVQNPNRYTKSIYSGNGELISDNKSIYNIGRGEGTNSEQNPLNKSMNLIVRNYREY